MLLTSIQSFFLLFSLYLGQLHNCLSLESTDNAEVVADSSCIYSNSETCIAAETFDDNDPEIGFDEQWEMIKNSKSRLKNLYIDCVDTHTECENWANHGECQANPHYMQVSCRKSCGECYGYE